MTILNAILKELKDKNLSRYMRELYQIPAIKRIPTEQVKGIVTTVMK